MFAFLTKSLLVIGSCGGLAFLSTRWIKPQEIEAIHKVNFNNQEKTIKEIKRLEEIDVWAKENGCNFIFVKDWKKNQIYNAKEYAEASGGKNKNLGRGEYGSKFKHKFKTLEQAMVDTVNEYKGYCDYKLKSFTFLWNPVRGYFYIGDPNKKSEVEKWADKTFYF